MTGFRADLEALADLVGRIEAFDRGATSIAADLEHDARRLAGQWSGAAADRHDAAYRRWTQAHAELRRAASELAGFVRTAHANYTGAAGANERMWG